MKQRWSRSQRKTLKLVIQQGFPACGLLQYRYRKKRIRTQVQVRPVSRKCEGSPLRELQVFANFFSLFRSLIDGYQRERIRENSGCGQNDTQGGLKVKEILASVRFVTVV